MPRERDRKLPACPRERGKKALRRASGLIGRLEGPRQATRTVVPASPDDDVRVRRFFRSMRALGQVQCYDAVSYADMDDIMGTFAGDLEAWQRAAKRI